MTRPDASRQPAAAVIERAAAGRIGPATPPPPGARPARRFWPTLPTTERQRVRWFVAGHVLAVWLVFQLALWVGDGHAPAPFPPDLGPAERARALALPAGPASASVQEDARHDVVAPPAAMPAEWSRPLEWSR